MVVVRSRGKGSRVSDGVEGVLNQHHPSKPCLTLLHLHNSNTSLKSPQAPHSNQWAPADLAVLGLHHARLVDVALVGVHAMEVIQRRLLQRMGRAWAPHGYAWAEHGYAWAMSNKDLLPPIPGVSSSCLSSVCLSVCQFQALPIPLSPEMSSSHSESSSPASFHTPSSPALRNPKPSHPRNILLPQREQLPRQLLAVHGDERYLLTLVVQLSQHLQEGTGKFEGCAGENV